MTKTSTVMAMTSALSTVPLFDFEVRIKTGDPYKVIWQGTNNDA